MLSGWWDSRNKHVETLISVSLFISIASCEIHATLVDSILSLTLSYFSAFASLKEVYSLSCSMHCVCRAHYRNDPLAIGLDTILWSWSTDRIPQTPITHNRPMNQENMKPFVLEKNSQTSPEFKYFSTNKVFGWKMHGCAVFGQRIHHQVWTKDSRAFSLGIFAPMTNLVERLLRMNTHICVVSLYYISHNRQPQFPDV